jgi:hypothetical protein
MINDNPLPVSKLLLKNCVERHFTQISAVTSFIIFAIVLNLPIDRRLRDTLPDTRPATPLYY